jgi:hypothetical protein
LIPFAIAGVQMHVAAVHDNVGAMKHRLDLLMARQAWRLAGPGLALRAGGSRHL